MSPTTVVDRGAIWSDLVTVGDVLEAAGILERALDEALDRSRVDTALKGLVDWSWYRFSTLNVLVRDEGSGVTVACLARGLLEEAAYWDWRAATGADTYWIAGKAVAELQRLVDRAAELGDDVWTEWLLPPGSSVASPGRVDPPNSTADAVARIGYGFPREYYGSLPVDKLTAIHRLLSVLSHGNLVAPGAVRASSGWEGSDELSALAVHVAGASSALVTIGALGLARDAATGLTRAAVDLADAATDVHGVSGSPVSVKGRAAKPTRGAQLAASSTIRQMPGPPRVAVDAGRRFVETATAVLRDHGRSIAPHDAISDLAAQALRFGASQLDVARAVLNGHVGHALLPYVARPVMEAAALWSWAAQGLGLGETELRRRLHEMIGQGAELVRRIRSEFEMRSAGGSAAAGRLLGDAMVLLEVAGAAGVTRGRVPGDYLEVGFRSWGGADWAAPTYGVLSQFVHVTPIALLHLKPGGWHSLSAPAFCVALDAFAKGLTVLTHKTLPIAGVRYQDVEDDFVRLAEATVDVSAKASSFHFIG